MARPPPARLLGALLLLAAGSAVAALASEAAARLLWERLAHPDGSAPVAARAPELAALPELETALELATPRARGLHHGVLHRTNRFGIRGPEITPAPPPGTFRIAVVGDSFTMGHRVREEETYCARLESDLDRRGPGRFQVLNLGLSGMTAPQALRRLERVGLPLRPDLVVYGFTLNDIEALSPRDPSAPNPFLEEMARFGDSPSRLLRAMWPRWVLLRSSLRPLPGSYEHELQRLYFEDPEAFPRVERVFAGLARLADEAGICGHVFVHPLLYQLNFLHPFSRIYARVEQAARARGLSVSQAFPVFRGRDAAALRFGLLDSHPNAEGHRLLARALREGLERLPAECGLPAEQGAAAARDPAT